MIHRDTLDCEYNDFPKIKRNEHIVVKMKWELDSRRGNFVVNLQANVG